MSQFTTPLRAEILGDYKFKTIGSFIYFVGNISSEEQIVVPEGFITDLASIPRVFWNILPPNGQYAKAAVLHDYLYQNAIKNKAYADGIFLEAMEVLGVAKWKRVLMYRAVRLFGRGNYQLSKTKGVTLWA